MREKKIIHRRIDPPVFFHGRKDVQASSSSLLQRPGKC